MSESNHKTCSHHHDGPRLLEADACHVAVLADIQAACFDHAWGQDAFAKLLALRGHRAWILCENERPLGYALMQIVADEAELLSIAVLPDQRSQGRGKQILGETLKRCSLLNISKIVLDVATDNVFAIRLYEGFGFKQVGLRKNYYNKSSGEKIDASVMTLEC